MSAATTTTVKFTRDDIFDTGSIVPKLYKTEGVKAYGKPIRVEMPCGDYDLDSSWYGLLYTFKASTVGDKGIFCCGVDKCTLCRDGTCYHCRNPRCESGSVHVLVLYAVGDRPYTDLFISCEKHATDGDHGIIKKARKASREIYYKIKRETTPERAFCAWAKPCVGRDGETIHRGCGNYASAVGDTEYCYIHRDKGTHPAIELPYRDYLQALYRGDVSDMPRRPRNEEVEEDDVEEDDAFYRRRAAVPRPIIVPVIRRDGPLEETSSGDDEE